MRIYIFGYGSLLYAKGINGRGIKRKYVDADLKEATLYSYKREWNGCLPAFGYRYLGIVRDMDHFVNGVIFPIEESDMPAFIRSEGGDKVYSFPDVTDSIDDRTRADLHQLSFARDNKGYEPFKVISCVVRSPAYDLQIGKYYVDIVKDALDLRGPEFKRIFWETTPKPDGILKR